MGIEWKKEYAVDNFEIDFDDWETWYYPDGSLRWVSPSVERLTGFSVAECLTMQDYPLPMIAPDDVEAYKHILTTAIQPRTRDNDVEFRIRHKNGNIRWMAVS